MKKLTKKEILEQLKILHEKGELTIRIGNTYHGYTIEDVKISSYGDIAIIIPDDSI